MTMTDAGTLEMVEFENMLDDTPKCQAVRGHKLLRPSHACLVTATWTLRVECNGLQFLWCDNRYVAYQANIEFSTCAYCHEYTSDCWTITPL